MRINAHSHLFNLASIFTEETAAILLNRVTESEMPFKLKQHLAKGLQKMLSKEISQEEFFADLANKLDVTKELKSFAEELSGGTVSLDFDAGQLLGKSANRLVELLWQFLLRKYDAAAGGQPQQNWLDWLAFLRTAVQPSLENTADIILGDLEEDQAVVALMMDIVGKSQIGDDTLFRKQMQDTSDLFLAYPGRVFGFVKVNPLRERHFFLMQMAIEELGFWGVKIYPSLGYDPASSEMLRVYEYCAARGVPIMTHCNDKGYRKDKSSADFANPKRWTAILDQYPALKICFAHFGGDEWLVQSGVPATSWSKAIIDLIQNPKYPNVYTDISFHTDTITGNKKLGLDAAACRKHYAKNLSALLKSGVCRDHILFGTDSWLVRSVCGEQDYWRYFQDLFGRSLFKVISEKNPARYLGLPGSADANTFLLDRHLAFLDRKKWKVQREPAAWLKDEARAWLGHAAPFIVMDEAQTWETENPIHMWVWFFLDESGVIPAVSVPSGPERVEQIRKLGRRKVALLPAWSSQMPGSLRAGELRRLAGNLDKFLRKQKCERLFGDASDKLLKAFNNPDLYLHEVAAVAAKSYKAP